VKQAVVSRFLEPDPGELILSDGEANLTYLNIHTNIHTNIHYNGIEQDEPVAWHDLPIWHHLTFIYEIIFKKISQAKNHNSRRHDSKNQNYLCKHTIDRIIRKC